MVDRPCRSDQFHSRVQGQWYWVLWQLSVSDLLTLSFGFINLLYLRIKKYWLLLVYGNGFGIGKYNKGLWLVLLLYRLMSTFLSHFLLAFQQIHFLFLNVIHHVHVLDSLWAHYIFQYRNSISLCLKPSWPSSIPLRHTPTFSKLHLCERFHIKYISKLGTISLEVHVL